MDEATEDGVTYPEAALFVEFSFTGGDPLFGDVEGIEMVTTTRRDHFNRPEGVTNAQRPGWFRDFTQEKEEEEAGRWPPRPPEQVAAEEHLNNECRSYFAP